MLMRAHLVRFFIHMLLMGLRNFNILGCKHACLLFSLCALEIIFLTLTAFELSREKGNYFALTAQCCAQPKILSDHL